MYFMQDQIFDILMQKEDVTWRDLIMDLVSSEGMDPWNLNLNLLTQKYIDTIKTMQEHDLKISGKILLAAALLLKFKSKHLVNVDIQRLDQMFESSHDDFEENEDDFEEEDYDDSPSQEKKEKRSYQLIPRNPQPRNRKVSIDDLVNALQRAMTTKKKVLEKIKPEKFEKIRHRKIDIGEAIEEIYSKIEFYSQSGDVTYNMLLPHNPTKEEKVFTFLPLLHLENHMKIGINQEEPFKEIHIGLIKNINEDQPEEN